ncbi:Putative cysteine peptidase, cysteine active, peptidase C2, calpain, catalytic [Septoria linicola]|uniref:Cysteine peptidase, cysteine active, peptidase C2, calpain, catalytic n=1 Tax=Septoria linicola TaxID=215465 RepID=A0A9Q9AW59_9PEZI|nr:Putative cysteine peptidase, cysteine active, peptidase C2, calpain, catalytic [Septoria linicola]
MADPEPADPVPAIPIKIVASDPAPPPAPLDDIDISAALPGKRTDDFYPAWEQFLSIQPKRAKKTSRAAQKLEEEKEAIEHSKTANEGLQVQENAAKSWEEAATECRAKVAAIVDECKRLNQKYRDALFDLETNQYCLQSLAGSYPKAVDSEEPPPWVTRVPDIFDNPQFYIDDATANDVHQGNSGDCWFLAALMAVSAKKDLIEKLCVARDEKTGVYGFVFFRDGEWIYEVVDDKLFLRVGDDDDLEVVRDWDRDKKEGMRIKYDDEKLKEALQKDGLALYFGHCKSNETWLPLIEKAYAKAHGDYYAIEGGFASEGIEDLTGGVAVILNPEDIMDKDRFWTEQLSQVNVKYLFGGGSKPTGSKGFVGGHAYAVLDKFEEGDLKLLKLKNPWGEVEWEGDWSDGSKLWTAEMMTKLKHTFGDDGIFWISYKDFLKHFYSINRVRLFDDSWTVAQQWTCVNVPWTVDYLDTKFQFTISEKGPAVIVLAQPDDRYYYGLRGRMLYSMHFRLYQDGKDEEDGRWIVRSMHNSGAETVFTRSVSAEIEDLEAGTYDVVFKVTPIRSTGGITAAEAIMKYAVNRKEKLLNVGRRFDYAQSKGNLRAMEKQNRRQLRAEKRDKDTSTMKKVRSLNRQDRERARKRKTRIHDAMNVKLKDFHAKRSERMKARRDRRKAKKEAAEAKARAAASLTAESDDKNAQLTPAESTPSTANIDAITTEEKPVDKPAGSEDVPQPDAEAKSEPEAPAQAANETGQINPTAVPEPDPAPQPEANVDPNTGSNTEDLSKKLSDLTVQDKPPINAPSTSPISPLDDDDNSSSESAWESPLEPPDELEDDDFDWDSELDGPVPSRSSSSGESDSAASANRRSRAKKDIFGDDPWNAPCVLGLRVYSKCKDVKVSVVKGENSS